MLDFKTESYELDILQFEFGYVKIHKLYTVSSRPSSPTIVEKNKTKGDKRI